jgi:hypothetical protein
MLKINCAPILKALIYHRPGSAGKLQNKRKLETQRAVNEKNGANMEGYKQVQSDSMHLLNTRGIQMHAFLTKVNSPFLFKSDVLSKLLPLLIADNLT